MKTDPSSRFQALWMGIVLLCLFAAPLCAEQFGLFTYQVIGNTVEITDYPTSETGDVEIPAMIDGKPVTSIGNHTFAFCSALTKEKPHRDRQSLPPPAEPPAPADPQ